jgi:hypothetical protein
MLTVGVEGMRTTGEMGVPLWADALSSPPLAAAAATTMTITTMTDTTEMAMAIQRLQPQHMTSAEVVGGDVYDDVCGVGLSSVGAGGMFGPFWPPTYWL